VKQKLPTALWFLSGATVATLIIGIVLDKPALFMTGIIGGILTAAAFAMYWTRNDPPQDEDDETINRW